MDGRVERWADNIYADCSTAAGMMPRIDEFMILSIPFFLILSCLSPRCLLICVCDLLGSRAAWWRNTFARKDYLMADFTASPEQYVMSNSASRANLLQQTQIWLFVLQHCLASIALWLRLLWQLIRSWRERWWAERTTAQVCADGWQPKVVRVWIHGGYMQSERLWWRRTTLLAKRCMAEIPYQQNRSMP